MDNSDSPSLTSLPYDVLREILLFTPYKDVHSFSVVCQTLRDIYDESDFWPTRINREFNIKEPRATRCRYFVLYEERRYTYSSEEWICIAKCLEYAIDRDCASLVDYYIKRLNKGKQCQGGNCVIIQLARLGRYDIIDEFCRTHSISYTEIVDGIAFGAAQAGHEFVVMNMIERGCGAVEHMLEYAGLGGHQHLIKKLLDLNTYRKSPRCLLVEHALKGAAKGGHEKLVMKLLKLGKCNIGPAFEVATKKGYCTIIQKLWEYRSDDRLFMNTFTMCRPTTHDSGLIEYVSEYASEIVSIIINLIRSNKLEIVRVILDMPIELNRQDFALLLDNAIYYGKLVLVKYLLGKGATLSPHALSFAVGSKRPTLMSFLLKVGDFDSRCRGYALQTSVIKSCYDDAKVLLDYDIPNTFVDAMILNLGIGIHVSEVKKRIFDLLDEYRNVRE